MEFTLQDYAKLAYTHASLLEQELGLQDAKLSKFFKTAAEKKPEAWDSHDYGTLTPYFVYLGKQAKMIEVVSNALNQHEKQAFVGDVTEGASSLFNVGLTGLGLYGAVVGLPIGLLAYKLNKTLKEDALAEEALKSRLTSYQQMQNEIKDFVKKKREEGKEITSNDLAFM